MKLFCFILSACIAITSISAQTLPTRKTNFDSDWKFAFGNANNPAKDFNYSIATIFSKSGYAPGTPADTHFNDSFWRALNLPHDWVVELPFVNSTSDDVESHGYKPVGGLFPETSIGWYRKHFTIAASDSGHRFQIQFDGIFRDAMIWVNGFFVGNNKSGYVGCAYDITDFINYHSENVITVRVDATQYEGWFYEGAGIYRHAWLNEYNNTHIATDGVFVFSNMEGKNAILSVQSSIQNQTGTINNCTVLSYITDKDGNIVARSAPQKAILNNGTTTIPQTIIVTNPTLWSVDSPYLYRAVVLVKDKNNNLVDSTKTRFGIRTIDVTDSGLFVNGVYTKIHGMCNHQDAAGVGSALPDYLQYYRVRLLKQMGVNAYRTSHNAATPELLDACDSLGMLVLEEQRLLNSSDEYISQFEKIIKRDRSHPSIFMWSIGNEEFAMQTTSYGKRIAQTLIQKQKELDPTRTSTYAADVPNVFQGVNEVIPVRGFNYREKFVTAYHKDHPTQPIVGTEMGSTVTTRGIYIKDTINAYVPDEDTTHPWWSSTAESWWKLHATDKWWMGGFVWTGFDYRGEPTPYNWPNINSHFGVLDVCGFPKNISYYYKSWWSDFDVLQLSPHWNWQGKEEQPIDVWVNSNADNVELFLNGKSLGKKDMPRNGHLNWSVNYEPGTLQAIGYRNGRKLMSEVETSDKPNTVIVTPYKTTMLADGKDVSVINISVIDKNGVEVATANNLIHFSVSGDAKIIGVGNGDPSSHEQDKYNDTVAQRHLFNGKCQVIVQSGNTKSLIHFVAKADSLYEGNTDIAAIQPGVAHLVTKADNTFPITKFNSTPVDKMLGADISFLPELEAKGMKFSDNGVEKDAIQILKDHGFNYVRLRIFVDPQNDSGYSPQKGFCDLNHTKEMAKRVKAAGMKFLLDFHYSDYWADPGKQFKPKAWENENFTQLKQSVYDYTKMVMQQLKDQNTTPDMVQVGNEINHGMIWPDGYINNLDSLSQLIYAGINAVKSVSSSTSIILHLALGGQNDEARFWLDNMIERGVQFDVIGLSYYPRWHGTLDDLQYNLADLSSHYNKDVIVVEYSHKKQEVNQLAFNVPNGRGKGTCIWEPLSTWESFFDKDGKANKYLYMYDDISKEYLKK